MKGYVNEWVPVVRKRWSPVGDITDGEFLVHRYGIITTDFVVYEVYEMDEPYLSHGTITYHDEHGRLGRLGTKTHTDEEYEECYRIIESVYPDLDGTRCMGSITRHEVRS